MKDTQRRQLRRLVNEAGVFDVLKEMAAMFRSDAKDARHPGGFDESKVDKDAAEDFDKVASVLEWISGDVPTLY